MDGGKSVIELAVLQTSAACNNRNKRGEKHTNITLLTLYSCTLLLHLFACLYGWYIANSLNGYYYGTRWSAGQQMVNLHCWFYLCKSQTQIQPIQTFIFLFTSCKVGIRIPVTIWKCVYSWLLLEHKNKVVKIYEVRSV